MQAVHDLTPSDLDHHWREARAEMVDQQIARRGVADSRVLEAMGAVPRERFVPSELRHAAYDDGPLPIGEGQTISQPYVVACMLELAQISPGDTVLEVGAGSGYAAAVLSRLAARVYAIERWPELSKVARARLAAIGVSNVEVLHGDGSHGCAAHAPFQAIIVSAGGGQVPKALRKQLAIGGRLVMPVGAGGPQILTRVIRLAEDRYTEQPHGVVAFVPLVVGQPQPSGP